MKRRDFLKGAVAPAALAATPAVLKAENTSSDIKRITVSGGSVIVDYQKHKLIVEGTPDLKEFYLAVTDYEGEYLLSVFDITATTPVFKVTQDTYEFVEPWKVQNPENFRGGYILTPLVYAIQFPLIQVPNERTTLLYLDGQRIELDSDNCLRVRKENMLGEIYTLTMAEDNRITSYEVTLYKQPCIHALLAAQGQKFIGNPPLFAGSYK